MHKGALAAVATAICIASAHGEESALKQCASVAKAAEAIMTGRQGGFDILEAYELAKSADPRISELMTEMTTMAYEKPAYRTEDHASKAISDFKSEMMVRCMKAKQ